MIIKNGLVWEESGSFLTKDLHIDSDTHRIAMDSADTADDTICLLYTSPSPRDTR